jgi:two-component system sensor histidine kinase HydH
MIQEVERLNRVVTELLEYARPTELCRRHVSCRGLIAQALQLVQREADQRQVTIGVRVEPEGMKMDVDPDRFVQVLLNLFLNGLQAMENGGVLSVEVKNEGTEAVLAVSDTGSGISIENLPHVFDPYFTTKPGGVGLGLANVHKLVEAHGGKVEVSSGSGSGTRFVVRIPETSPGQRPMAPERQGRQEATS